MTRHLLAPALTVTPLGPAFGAVVEGIDLRQVDAGIAGSLSDALVQYKVLFFHDQQLDDEAHVRLGELLGPLTPGHPVAAPLDGSPNIYNIDSSDPEFSFSDVWHTDVTFMRKPPAISILRSVTLPDSGGDTSWADLQAAYESLSRPVRDLVDQLTATHDGNREWGHYLRRHGGRGYEWDGEVITSLPPVSHPVVRIHPVSGRKGLFVNPGFTSHIDDVSDAESRGLLDLLYAHITKPEHTVRHRWAAGDVGIWDNRATAHYANNDYDQARVMRRVTLAGDLPVGPDPRVEGRIGEGQVR